MVIGKLKFIDEFYVNENVIVIDVGILFFEGKIIGDVDFDKVIDKCKFLILVLGGVGVLIIIFLIKNVCEVLREDEY